MTNSRKEPYLLFNRLTGFTPRQIELYELALLHKSMGARDSKGNLANNERLEFLGDAIITAIVSDIVYDHFREKEEGFLTNIRSKIVQREMLNKIAIEMGIPTLIQIPTGSQLHGNNVFGNALEALVGAIYLDQGFSRCKAFIQHRIIDKSLNMNYLANKEVNFKSRLIEWGQSHRVPVVFEVVETFQNRQNEVTFQAKALINSQLGGIGIGHSKKESQQQAAKIAMVKLHEDKQFVDIVLNSAVAPSSTSQEQTIDKENANYKSEAIH
ncbi:ribonuclease III [Microbacter margulisiae]|uniref:Ribonuclease 3 n=1 Tax=Microbacter margulisiae TaxID=1350067 RepID=A0A7W5DQY8_9PORP|nr:ribonuclease III [Microbacter margulisiae]MBB3187351.1 ribonuclease-3 [Microbacter margulisiae]